jgi:hypothetical protein
MRFLPFVVAVFAAVPLVHPVGASAQDMASSPSALFGSWRWKNDCRRPDFIFQRGRVTMNVNADGALIKFVFRDAKYERGATKSSVIVNFGEDHGLAGVESDTAVEAVILDAMHALIKRSKEWGDIDLRRCQ